MNRAIEPRRGLLTRTGLVLMSVVALVSVACGSEAETAQDGTAADKAPAAVAIKGFIFKPSPLEVKAGTEVTWTNEDQILHTVTAGVPGSPTGTFDQEMPDRGAGFSFTFDQPGSYPYFCGRHNSMTGTVIVSTPSQ